MVQAHFSLSWDSYKTNLSTGFSGLQQNGELVDMTLAADGHFVKVHQVLIALSSSYLKQLILSAPCQHPVIFLNNVSHLTLTSLLEYIYTGQVSVPSNNLSSFIETAKTLHIKGLENIDEGNSNKDIHTPKNNESNSSISRSVGIKRKASTSDQINLPLTARKVLVKHSGNTTITLGDKKSQITSDNEETNDFSIENALQDSDTDFNDTQKNDKDKGTAQLTSSNLQYTVSIRGSLQVILNRYIYNLNSSQSSGVRRWRCTDYRNKKCNAFVVTQDNIVLNRNLHALLNRQLLQYKKGQCSPSVSKLPPARNAALLRRAGQKLNSCSFQKKYNKSHIGDTLFNHVLCVELHTHYVSLYECGSHVMGVGAASLTANPHNHSFHDKKILDKIEKNAVYSAIDDVKGVIDKEKPKDNHPMESEFVSLSFNTELDDLQDTKYKTC